MITPIRPEVDPALTTFSPAHIALLSPKTQALLLDAVCGVFLRLVMDDAPEQDQAIVAALTDPLAVAVNGRDRAA